jgi:heme/copper-type cytochrome/quinol oxidase subunit 2
MNVSAIFACATCIGQSGQQDVVAANGAVFVMIGALGIVFLGIMGVLFSFVRRARRANPPS